MVSTWISIIKKLDHIEYRRIVWALSISETFHNIEEAIWIPATLQYAERWNFTIGAFEFRFALIVFTLLLYGIIYYFSVKTSKTSSFLIGGLIVSILYNVFMPHIIGSIITFKYFAGVTTGILLNIPVSIYLLRRGIQEGYLNFKSVVQPSIVLLLLTIPILQILFFLGRAIYLFIEG